MINFYIDEAYYNVLVPQTRQGTIIVINGLASTYENNILPRLRSFLETDIPKANIALSSIKQRAGGYFNYSTPDNINLNTEFLF